jgi:hypothetical protein
MDEWEDRIIEVGTWNGGLILCLCLFWIQW